MKFFVFLKYFQFLNNSKFNSVGFDTVRTQAGLNSFTISPSKWIEKTNSKGIITKSGRYNSGTYAHEDIALEFASWVSSEFKLYLIKEFQRLKYEENKKNSLNWNLKRELVKINYKIHTDAIKENLIPPEITSNEAKIIYASEADILNKALFGMTAKEWSDKNANKKGNIRDYANVKQLVVLSNLENLNSVFIKDGLSQENRLLKLNKIAIKQIKVLIKNDNQKVFIK